MVGVTGAIKVCWHHTPIIHPMTSAVLTVVAFTQLDTGDLRNGVRLVGWFKQASKKRRLFHRLSCQTWINTARAKKQKPFDAIPESSLDHIGLDHQVLVNEVCRIGTIGMDATNFCCCQVDLIWLFRRKKTSNSGLVSQIKFSTSPGNNVSLASLLQGANNRRAHHASVASNIYFDLSTLFESRPLLSSKRTMSSSPK